MLARLRKTRDENDQGFTLIELLVVMIIIGILAAIAVPVFLSQRKKAADSSAKSDVSTIGKELASYYVDGTLTAYATYTAGTPGTIALGTTSTGSEITTVKLSNGTTGVGTAGAASVGYLATSATNCSSVPLSGRWYIGVQNSNGTTGTQYFYSATSGLTTAAPTTC